MWARKTTVDLLSVEGFPYSVFHMHINFKWSLVQWKTSEASHLQFQVVSLSLVLTGPAGSTHTDASGSSSWTCRIHSRGIMRERKSYWCQWLFHTHISFKWSLVKWKIIEASHLQIHIVSLRDWLHGQVAHPGVFLTEAHTVEFALHQDDKVWGKAKRRSHFRGLHV